MNDLNKHHSPFAEVSKGEPSALMLRYLSMNGLDNESIRLFTLSH